MKLAPTPRPVDSEKITINLGPVDLGRIDLLVQEGFYGNRTDFIRMAIRTQLTAEADTLAGSIARHRLDLGLRDVTRAELERLRDAGHMVQIRIVGLVRIAADVSVELAVATIASITVLGALQAPGDIKAALKDRIR